MFEKFGEFDSAKELNMCAERLLAEGKTGDLMELAEENGIDVEDARDYADGCTGKFVNTLMAAQGKIEAECRELKPVEIMEDWVEYIKIQCVESELMAAAVRRKGKSIKGCIAELLKWSFAHQIPVGKEILKEAGVSAGRVTLGIPGMGTAKRIITEYYMEKRQA